MVPAGNKAKCLSSVNHTTITIHHHHCGNSHSTSGVDYCFLKKVCRVAYYRVTGFYGNIFVLTHCTDFSI